MPTRERRRYEPAEATAYRSAAAATDARPGESALLRVTLSADPSAPRKTPPKVKPKYPDGGGDGRWGADGLDREALEILSRHSAMRAVPVSARNWVTRAMGEISNHYAGRLRVERRENEQLAAELTRAREELRSRGADLSDRGVALNDAETAAERDRSDLTRTEREFSAVRSRRDTLERAHALATRQLDETSSRLARCQDECAELREALRRTDNAAKGLAARAAAAADERARVTADEKASLMKCLTREQAYHVSEQAGYRMHSVVQIAPSEACVPSLCPGEAAALAGDGSAATWHAIDADQITEIGGAL